MLQVPSSLRFSLSSVLVSPLSIRNIHCPECSLTVYAVVIMTGARCPADVATRREMLTQWWFKQLAFEVEMLQGLAASSR